MNQHKYKVAVDAPLDQALTYLAPKGSEFSRGQSVLVPLGRRTSTGVVLGKDTSTSELKFQLKEILSLDDSRPTLPEGQLLWLEWVSKYYLHPIGQVMALAFPPLKKSEKKRGRKTDVIPDLPTSSPPKHTEEQKVCLQKIKDSSGFQPFLILGVTGSGKTEVYLDLLKHTLERKKQGLVLVPEIALTPQLVNRFAARFGKSIAVIHSHLTEREKTDQWWAMQTGQAQILIGARSALFCPLENLGMIIVDEEHDSSYKQDEKLKYNARDAAVVLAKHFQCPVVLGSATPSLESYKNAIEEKYHLLTMKERVENRPLPKIEVVDLREIKRDRKENRDPSKLEDLPFWLSQTLYEKMDQRLRQREQTVLFLNRRGMSQVVVCPLCGNNRQCPNCSVTLTLHAKHHLVCHYCDYTENLPKVCPTCKESELQPLGLGTEKVEEDLKILFPNAQVARADRDEINSREDLESLIFKMEKREIDILVGTQMISKGLDFEGLTLVGLLLADIGFNLPDFRSTERSFQLLTQVSGRAGRHTSPGEVIIQTYNPDHPSIEFAKENNYVGFAKRELSFRKELHYPPHGKLVSLRIQGTDLDKVHHVCHALTARLKNLKKHFPLFSQVEVLGPAEAPLSKLRGKHRFHLLLKGPQHNALAAILHKTFEDKSWSLPAVQVSVDIDPIQML